jgi:hypothetical protein
MNTKRLNNAIQKLWGYSSEFGRHIREGRDPGFAEAVLVVGLAPLGIHFSACRLFFGHQV